MICSVSSMMKREVLEQLNGYDENLAYEDLDFWIRASRDYNFEFIDSVLVQKEKLKILWEINFIKSLILELEK